MNAFFSSKTVISTIHYSFRGYTKPGKYSYKNRNAYELGFRISGDTISSAQGKSFLVTKNCIVFKPKGVEDSCQTETGVEYYLIHFDIFDSPNYDFHVFKPKSHEKILECFKALIKEERKNGITLKCYSILYEILDLLNFNGEYLSSINKTILENAVTCIKENFHDNEFSINNVLSQVNISASQLRNLFHSKYAKSPIQYLIEKRIDYAKKLLLHSEYTIVEISELCGFNSPFYFSKIFKKYTSVAPSFYRKIHEEL